MRTNGWMLVTLSLLFLAGAVGCDGGAPTGEAGSGEEPTTIVLITVDGLIADQLALHGGPLSAPNLESLAEEGNFWPDAWTACPMTRPGAATYLSGLAPDRHGVRDDLFTALPDGTPTLATLLAEQGYRSAAFPDSSFLGFSSGLLDGFDLVADPPPVPVRPERWLPVIRKSEEVADDFANWLAGESDSQSLFGWAHFSDPLLAEMMRSPRREARKGKGKGKGREPQDPPAETSRWGRTREQVLQEFDTALGQILEAVARHRDPQRSLIIVAGTQGDPRGTESAPRGAGFSLNEAALQVPLIVRFPSGAGEARAGDEAVWAPDVPATIAFLAGASLPAGSEGVELTRTAPADRVLFAWSWATRDQAGWRDLRAARSKGIKRLEGLDEKTLNLGDPAAAEAAEAGEKLSAAIARRGTPAAPRVPLKTVRPFLETHGLALTPVPEEGRAFGTDEERSQLARALWYGRRAARLGQMTQARQRLEGANGIDPECLGAMLDLGMIRYLSGGDRALDLLGRAAELYPTDPEVLHWYAHALWRESWEDAEQLLLLILPHQPRDADLLYDLTCARSLAGDLDSSERYLRQAIAAGFGNWGHMETDPDLRNLRESGRYAAVLRDLRP